MAFWWFVRNTGCLCFFLCGCEYVCCLRVNCCDADWNFVSALFLVLGDRILLSTAAPLSFLGLTSLSVLCVVAWLTHNHSSVLPPLPRSSPPLSAETATVCPGLWPDLSCVFWRGLSRPRWDKVHGYESVGPSLFSEQGSGRTPGYRQSSPGRTRSCWRIPAATGKQQWRRSKISKPDRLPGLLCF